MKMNSIAWNLKIIDSKLSCVFCLLCFLLYPFCVLYKRQIKF